MIKINISIVKEAIKLCLFLSVTLHNFAFAEQHATLVFDSQMPLVNNKKQGSYAQLASLVDQQRSINSKMFFLFGGASLGPSALSSMDRGSHIVDILNSIQPDVMGISKQEFGFQEDELMIRSYEAVFPMVSSSLYDPLTKGVPEGILPYKILEKGDVKLGVISILDPLSMEKYPLKRLKIIAPMKAISQTVTVLKKHNVDLIILLYGDYIPIFDDLLQQGIVDVALFKGKHFQPSLHGNKHHPNNIIIDNHKNAAVIELTWQKNKAKKSVKLKTTLVDLTTLPSQPEVLRQEVAYDKQLNDLLGEKIGRTNTTINLYRKRLRTSENGFADFIADTFKDFTNAQLCIINSGVIRSDSVFGAGTELTRRDLLKILPYRNNIILIEVTGQTIISALEHGLSELKQVSGRYLQISGIKVKYDSTKPVGKRLLSVEMDGRPLEPTQKYRVVTSDYLYRAGDGYGMLKKGKVLSSRQIPNRLLSDIVIEAIQRKVHISPHTSGRIIDMANKN